MRGVGPISAAAICAAFSHSAARWHRKIVSHADARPLLTGGIALFIVLTAAFSFSVDIRATRGASITGDEPFYLLTTQSLLQDGDLDLRQQYAARSYESFFDHPDGLWRQSQPLEDDRLLSPHDLGLSVYVIPGFAIGGLRGVQWQMLFTTVTAFVLTYLLVARLSRRPRLSWLVTVTVGLSATAFVYSTEIYPESVAALLVVASLLGITAQARPHGALTAISMALLLVGLVWLGAKYAPLSAILALAWFWGGDMRGRATFAAVIAAAAGSYLWFNWETFGQPTPYAVNVVYAGSSTGDILNAHLEFEGRSYRLWGLFVDRRFGLGHWAPFLLLVVPALPFLVRKGLVTQLAGALILIQLLIATYVAITMMGWWFPGRTLMAVLPVMAVPITLMLVEAKFWLRVVSGMLAVLTIATTAALAWAGHAGDIVLAVNPWEMTAIFWRELSPAFPQYTSWGTETHLLNAAWITAGLLALLLTARAAWHRQETAIAKT